MMKNTTIKVFEIEVISEERDEKLTFSKAGLENTQTSMLQALASALTECIDKDKIMPKSMSLRMSFVIEGNPIK